ncbi:MAG: hypothetical protein Sapg2KO_30570 [Saprospiraceae bacterium]
MKMISLEIQNQTLLETEYFLSHLNLSRDEYITEAIVFYNQYQRRKLLAEQLIRESKLIQEDSINVLHEFEAHGHLSE